MISFVGATLGDHKRGRIRGMENSQEDPLQIIKNRFYSEHYGDESDIVLPSDVEWLIAEVTHLRTKIKSLEKYR
jgi:hypothetical protein